MPDTAVVKERKAALEEFLRKQPFNVIRDVVLVSNHTRKGVSDVSSKVRSIGRELIMQDVRVKSRILLHVHRVGVLL